MIPVSLGFEPDTTISKSSIAQTQLVEAITLFLMGKYVCSITLSGAAEAVFAGLLNQQGDASVVEESFNTIRRVRSQTKRPVMGDRKNTDIFNQWNDARNKLKHHGQKESVAVTLNLFDEAYWMLRRCLANAEMLDIPISNRDEFENWIVLNINM